MLPKSKTCRKTLMIKGVGIVDVVSIMGLARMVGKSKISILRYEAKDIFPEAPIKVRDQRYYPISLAEKLIPIVRKFPLNTTPSAELIAEVSRVFNEETAKLCPK